MASAVQSTYGDHKHCHGRSAIGASSATASQAPRLMMHEHPAHEHAVHPLGTDRGPSGDVPSPGAKQSHSACCPPAGLAVLPQLALVGGHSSPRGDKLALVEAQVPAGHTPEGPRKPPRTPDQL